MGDFVAFLVWCIPIGIFLIYVNGVLSNGKDGRKHRHWQGGGKYYSPTQEELNSREDELRRTMGKKPQKRYFR